MKILISYRGAPKIRGWETGALLASAFRTLGHEVDEYAKIYEHDLWLSPINDVFSKEYDIHVFCECNDGDRQYLELKKISANKKVCWFFDIEMYPDFCYSLIREMNFDLLYSANINFNNFKYLPYAAHKNFYRDITTPKIRDVVLVGSDRPERRNLIKTLRKHNINAELISGVYKDNYIDVLASSKIVLNDNAGGGSALLSMRAFEATAAGSMLLQNNTPSLKGIFEDGVQCAVFSSHESLIDSCVHYLSDDDERLRLTNNGQKWIMEYHTYVNRAMEIING